MPKDYVGEILLGGITGIFMITLFFFVALPRYYEVPAVKESSKILKINPYLWGFTLISVILVVLVLSIIAGRKKDENRPEGFNY